MINRPQKAGYFHLSAAIAVITEMEGGAKVEIAPTG
jgi:hypothetical protein